MRNFPEALLGESQLGKHIKRLRIVYEAVPSLPIYTAIIRRAESWDELSIRSSPDTTEEAILDGMLWESQQMDKLGGDLFLRQTGGTVDLPALERVVMSCSPNRNWARLVNRPGIALRLATGPRHKSLPLALLNCPNVKHFCQSDILGPLALDPELIRLPHTPEIVSHHMQYGHALGSDQDAPAIVLGAVNRYYFPVHYLSVFHPSITITANEHRLILDILGPMFVRTDVVTRGDGAATLTKQDLLPNMVDGTIVELYNFVRTYVMTDTDGRQYQLGIWNASESTRNKPAGPLDGYQRTLDTLLPLWWKNKVILRNREDAPSCTACGLDREEQFRRSQDLGPWHVPE